MTTHDLPGEESREFIGRLRAGEPGAYEALVRAFSPRMLAAARRILRDPEEAQDAVQDAFLAAFRALGSFHGEARLGTWLHRILINAALMRLRRSKRRPEGSIDDLLPHFDETGHHAVPPQPWNVSPERLLVDRDLHARVRAEIERLPDKYRTVLLLRDVEELDTEETARLLGVTPTAVKLRLHRARQALRTRLDVVLARPGSTPPATGAALAAGAAPAKEAAPGAPGVPGAPVVPSAPGAPGARNPDAAASSNRA